MIPGLPNRIPGLPAGIPGLPSMYYIFFITNKEIKLT